MAECQLDYFAEVIDDRRNTVVRAYLADSPEAIQEAQQPNRQFPHRVMVSFCAPGIIDGRDHYGHVELLALQTHDQSQINDHFDGVIGVLDDLLDRFSLSRSGTCIGAKLKHNHDDPALSLYDRMRVVEPKYAGMKSVTEQN